MAGAELARSATEQPHVDMDSSHAGPASVGVSTGPVHRASMRPVWDHRHSIATERSLVYVHTLDSEILLRKDPEIDRTAVRIKTHHDRAPDVGIGILISMPSYRAAGEAPEMIEYRGEYLGHGQSKTAFELNCPDAMFHGYVLKVAKSNDMEPAVFMEAAPLGLTTGIYYNCDGVDADTGHRFHCWITDRTIPLDELCRYEIAVKSRCSLAAFYCMLSAAQHGLFLSDCHFYNFGVRLSETATEHLVRIIDAGSRGIDRERLWAKSRINKVVMHKFWKACDEVSASYDQLKNMWWNSWDVKHCLQRATQEWQNWPILTDVQESTNAIWQAMIAKDSFRRSTAHSNSAYKMMELVGRFTAEQQWSRECFWTCYRAVQSIPENSKLSPEEYNILDELYSRITTSRARDAELHDVMMFWRRLDKYRERECQRMMQDTQDQPVTPDQAFEMLESFKHNELWYDLTWQQRQRTPSKQHATLNAILHRRAGWTHAARAIMEYGLPKLEQPAQPDDATEHINALGQFARDMAKWLVNFASSMHAYRQTADYQKNYQRSMTALRKRTRRDSEDSR